VGNAQVLEIPQTFDQPALDGSGSAP
jgi:hypothetical protein